MLHFTNDPELKERNRDIFLLWMMGISGSKVARFYGISPGRACQIVKEMRQLNEM